MALIVLAAVLGSARAVQYLVPDNYIHISDGVVAASDGDTVSVWGYGTPPFVYNENVNFGGKSVFLLNRSYLPNQTPARYTAAWDGRRADGSLLPNGVYVCKVETPTETFRRKVTVVR